MVFPSFFLGVGKRKRHLFSVWSFQEFTFEAVGPRFLMQPDRASQGCLASQLLLEIVAAWEPCPCDMGQHERLPKEQR